jgi:hypothetical protein
LQQHENPALFSTGMPAQEAGTDSAEEGGETSSTAGENDVIIYMDDYRKAQAIDVAAQRRYDEELLCVNWNPAIRVLALSCFQNRQELSPALPEDFSKIDADGFLDRVYALATQV